MKLFVLSCALFILLFSETLAKEATFPGEDKVLDRLAQKLTPKECWVVGNYLAQKALKPIPAQMKMSKIGGHAKDFDCLAALKLWATAILPPMIVKVQQKELYAKKQLQQSLGFAGRKDLRDWLKEYQVQPWVEELAAIKPVLQPEQLNLKTEPSGQVESEQVAVASHQANQLDEKPGEQREDTLEQRDIGEQKLDGKGTKSGKGKHAPAKKAITEEPTPDSTGKQANEIFKQVIKYVVLSVIGVVSLCLTVAIACSCRRRGRNAEGDEEEEGRGDGPSFHSTLSVNRGIGDMTGEDKYKDYEAPGRSTTVQNGDNFNANLYKNTARKA